MATNWETVPESDKDPTTATGRPRWRRCWGQGRCQSCGWYQPMSCALGVGAGVGAGVGVWAGVGAGAKAQLDDRIKANSGVQPVLASAVALASALSPRKLWEPPTG